MQTEITPPESRVITAEQINGLHAEISARHESLKGVLQEFLDRVIQLGELLAAKKAEITLAKEAAKKRGETAPGWYDWCGDNINFSVWTASRYMRVWCDRARVHGAESYRQAVDALEGRGAIKLLEDGTIEAGETSGEEDETDEDTSEVAAKGGDKTAAPKPTPLETFRKRFWGWQADHPTTEWDTKASDVYAHDVLERIPLLGEVADRVTWTPARREKLVENIERLYAVARELDIPFTNAKPTAMPRTIDVEAEVLG